MTMDKLYWAWLVGEKPLLKVAVIRWQYCSGSEIQNCFLHYYSRDVIAKFLQFQPKVQQKFFNCN